MPGDNLVPFLSNLPAIEPLPDQFRSAMISAGIQPPEVVIFDREIHRYGHNKRYWYVAFEDGIPGGAFGDWATGHGSNWRGNTGKVYTAMEEMQYLASIADAKKKAEIDRQIKAELAADTCRDLWEECTPATENHPYLARKGIKPHMARVNGEGSLVIPMYVDGELSSLQTILSDGTKLFHKGGRVKGAFVQFGEKGDKVYIAEGFATAATIYEETGVCTVASFSANNLPEVARQFPGSTIIADNDATGTGMNYATQASAKYGCSVILIPEVGQDANDFRAAGGDLSGLLNPSIETWLVNASEFAQKPAPIRWLVKHWLQADAMIMVHGPSGSGKTFVVLDWCLRIALGMDWLGNKTRQGPVVYLAGEGHHGLKGRVAAWLHHNNYTGPLNLWISKSGCDLDTPAGLQMALAQIRSLPEPPCLIVVDTLHRFLAGDENSAQDTKLMLDSCAVLREAFGATTLLVHHTGVSAEAQHRGRGSSSWKGALEIEISIQPTEAGLTISQKKAKDSDEAEDVFAELQPVAIPGWLDEDGEQVSSAVVIEGNQPEKKDKPDKAWSAFSDAFWTSGELTDDGPYLTKSALERSLVDVSGFSEATARQHIKPSFERGIVSKLMSSGKIRPHQNGFLVIDPALVSALSIAGNTGNTTR